MADFMVIAHRGASYSGRAHVHVEIKGRGPSLTERTVDSIRAHGMAEHVTITSFQKAALEETRAHAPGIPMGWLVPDATAAVIAQARALGCTQLCPRANVVTPELVRRLHADGFAVRAWGVGTEDLMRQVVDAGADGMTINFPDVALAYLAARR